MSKKFNIPNFDTKKLMDGAKLLADNGKIFLEKHGSKLAVVGLVGASIDNLKTRHKLKEKEENEVKTQQAVCKLQAMVEAASEEYEEVLCMNEKLQEALENTMEVHKDEEE